MEKKSRILIVGHNDVIENSLYGYFKDQGYKNIFSSSASGLDVLERDTVEDFFTAQRPEYVFLGSTRSGGIEANQKHGAEFLYHNIVSQTNIIHTAYEKGAKKLLYFASSCVYPKDTKQPMMTDALFTGPLESTNEPYAVAKIAGIKMCQAYKQQYGFNAIVGVPATVYGPGSDVGLATAHVMGALVKKFHEAAQAKKKEVVVWGTGKPRREFLFVDDFVDACILLMDRYDGEEIIHVGCGTDVTIRELARIIADVCGFHGKIVFDTTKPDGMKRKLLDNSHLSHLGWSAKVNLEQGIKKTYQWYRDAN